MLDMPPNRDEVSDHDLLIRLDERFSTFETSVARMLTDFNDKISRLLDHLEKKVDKSDFVAVEKKVEVIDTRVIALENDKIARDAGRQMIINIGSLGWKGWLLAAGIISLIIGLIKAK